MISRPTSSKTASLFAAASTLALALTAPSQAQVATRQAPDGARDDNTGKRIDHSAAGGLPDTGNLERESVQFGTLPPSSVSSDVRTMVTETTPRGQPAVIEDHLDSTTFESGRNIIRPDAQVALDDLVARLRGKSKLRFEVIGHTDNQRISARLRPTYPDNQALSQARAQAVASYIGVKLALPASAFAVSGRGETQPIASNDTPDGMAKNRRTIIRVWYEEEAPPAPPPRQVAKIVHQDYCAPDAPPAGLPFSVSVDGKPMDLDSNQTEGDRQRCVDVALDKSDIQVKYDPLNVAPSLNVWAVPGGTERGHPVIWRTYSNYAWWLKKAEIRVFVRGQSTQETPIAVIPVPVGGDVKWTPPADASEDLGYVLRVYDDKGRFDETSLKTLDLADHIDPAVAKERAEADDLSGYGESSLKVQNISASGGSVTISGDRVAADQTVSALGMPVPVDKNGKFVTRQILPAGAHQVDVQVKDAQGRVATFERNLNIADKDFFYVAVGDITVGRGHTTGPAALVTGDNYHYDNRTTVDGRAGFYLKGKVLGDYLLTASADTQEQPLKDLFSNFSSKDPDYLLRRIDPNLYYPIYGDDSTVVDDAPTQGKFYVKLERQNSYVMWGNFQTSWTGTELTQYSRGLYGGNLVYSSPGSTKFGERKTSFNAFAAEPGTLQSREEFRGTGGSLYYLHRQDLTEGSDRLWVEIRDKDSGLVLQRTLLQPTQDYDIDYLQGRVTLRAPLSSVADSGGLVQTAGLNGNPVFLVATYEYVPGLTAVHGSTIGARGSQWLNDYIRVGGTYYQEGDTGDRQTLEGLDGTLRYKAGTWLRGEVARSTGPGVDTFTSLTGGFDFSQNTTANDGRADAYRLDAAADLSDLSSVLKGRLTAFVQHRDTGFSGPGLLTAGGESLQQWGLAAVIPFNQRGEVAVKLNDSDQPSQRINSEEIAVRYKLNAEWGVSAGVRRDDQRTSADAVGTIFTSSTFLDQTGERTDGIVRVDYRPLAKVQPAKTIADNGTGPVTGAVPDGASASSMKYLANSGGTGDISTLTADANGPAGSLVPQVLTNAQGSVQTVVDPTAAAGVAAARLAGLEYQPWNLYGYAQDTFSRTGNRSENNRGGVGAGWQVNDRLRVGAEASDGSGGWGGRLATDYKLNDRSTLYLSYASETESPDENYAGREGILTAGGRTRITDQLGVFAESRAASGEGPHSLTHAFGVDYAPAKNWTTGARVEIGNLSDPVSGDLRRQGISVNVGYKDEQLKMASVVEFRHDKSTTLGTAVGSCTTTDTLAGNTACDSGAASDNRNTLLVKTTVNYQIDPAWRVMGSVNLSRSSSTQGAFYDGDYTELVAAAAYRPVNNDRWNTLFKYTYFYNLPSAGQVDSVTGSSLDFTQKSHVIDIDTIYDLFPWLSVGAKYGLRIGELKDSRVTGDWFSSQAQLFVLRTDLHFVKEWDAIAEVRKLDIRETHDSKSGVLLGVYRHINDNAKIGVGYNFTDFSDDLTDLSYKSRGFFINAIATF